MNIAVLCGGLSEEREVSLRTGEAIYQALILKGYKATKIDVTRDFLRELKVNDYDLAFLALHGKYGEDGTIQGYLEMLDIPYTGSGVLASAIAINKAMTKQILNCHGIPNAPFTVINKYSFNLSNIDTQVNDIIDQVGLPSVVKAATQGSSIGIYFPNTPDELKEAIVKAFEFDSEVVIEKFIKGVEVTASVLGNQSPVGLPLIEVVSNTGVYDYESKYTVGLSEHIIPARLSKEISEKIKDAAIKTYQAIGCRGLARVDFLVDEDNFFVLEINTMPGMTVTSLFPDAARAAGIEFPDLVEKLVKLSLGK